MLPRLYITISRPKQKYYTPVTLPCKLPLQRVVYLWLTIDLLATSIIEYLRVSRLYICSRCVYKLSGRCQVSRTTFYRHQQEQESRLPQEDREGGLRKCTSCPAFLNRHFTSRRTYYRHLSHQLCPTNPSAYILPY